MGNHKTQEIMILAGTVVVGITMVAIAYQNNWLNFKTSAPGLSQEQSTKIVPVTMVVGTVSSITGQTITLMPFHTVPSTDMGTTSPDRSMTVSIDGSTILERLFLGDSDMVAKANAEFSAKIDAIRTAGATGSASSSSFTVMAPFTGKRIVLGDIQVGDTATAYASKDIAQADSFTAVKVEVQSPSPASQVP